MSNDKIFAVPQGKLYLLSAPPGCGKSTWAKQLPAGMVVSSDALRASVLGVRQTRDALHHFQEANPTIFKIMGEIVAVRMRERLTTFVDAMLLTETDRNDFAVIAQKFGVDVEVLIFDRPVEVALERNAQRAARLPAARIEALYKDFVRASALPYRVVPDGSVPVVLTRQLPSTAIDVIGDVHGLLDELMVLLDKLGYALSSAGVPIHPQGRMLLFLGDVVDRGPQSIETLQFIRRAVAAGHFMVCGNHDRKLVQFWDGLQQGQPQARSRSAAETAMAFMKLGDEDRKALIEFVRKLPGHYVLEAEQTGGRALAFVHSNLVHFDPHGTLHTECLYGSEGTVGYEGIDTDAIYAENFANGDNTHWLFRGHIAQTSKQDCIFSLERDQAFGGHLVALPLDAFLAACESMSPAEAFEASIVTQKCEFNFDEHSKCFDLQRGLEQLVTDKLATCQVDLETGCRLYKYSKQVFFKGLWGESPYLLKARGIVLDLAGNIVVNPFDKVFNYGERDAGRDIADDTEVVAAEKLNGFLANISKHPFKKNDVLVTTTGSFDSQFVAYIRSFITPALKGSLLKFFSKNDVTLAFECIHGDDPHIVVYSQDERGLWLIGSRGKADGAPQATEEELDVIATQLAGVRRGKHWVTRFGDLKRFVATSQLEGVMVRSLDKQETLLKFKTPHYLVTKFIGRMTAGRVKFMYANPQVFKEKEVDEEFYPLVDELVARVPLDDFASMEEEPRKAIIRAIIADLT